MAILAQDKAKISSGKKVILNDVEQTQGCGGKLRRWGSALLRLLHGRRVSWSLRKRAKHIWHLADHRPLCFRVLTLPNLLLGPREHTHTSRTLTALSVVRTP